MKVKIEIDTRTFVRFWLVVIGFAFAILAIYSARQALILLGIALFLALALSKPVNLIASKLPGRSRVGATAIAYIFVVAIITAVVVLIIPPIVEQTARFVQTLPDLVDNATRQWRGLGQLITQYNLQPQVDSALESLRANASGWAANAGQNLLSGVGSVFAILTASLLVLVLSFLMLIEGPSWLKRIWGIYNDQERMEHHRNLVNRMYNMVTGYVTGQITVSALDGLAMGVGVFILSLFLNVPANLAIPTAAIAFLFSLIPVFGATIGGVLVSLLLVFNDPRAAVVYAIYFILYQQIENNLIAPTIQSRRLELSALAILGSVTIGLYVFGVAGGIISIPIAGCAKVLIEDYLSRARKNRIKSETPVAKLVKKIKGESA